MSVHAEVYLLADFHRWRKKAKVADATLCTIAWEVEQGLIDGDLGGSVIKKRIGIGGKGKRGGARAIIGIKAEERIFFLYAYAKNVRDNISEKERKAFQIVAQNLLSFPEKKLKTSIREGALIVLSCCKGER